MKLLDALSVLNRGSESVQAVMNSKNDTENRFALAIEALGRLAIENSIPIAIMDGLGAIRYGYPAVTEDIDILVNQVDLEGVVDLAPRYGIRVVWQAENGWHTLAFRDVEINVVPQGGKAKNNSPTLIPSPHQVGVSEGVGYACLEGWMELKLSSARQKDRAHVVEVLKKCDVSDRRRIREHIEKVHIKYLVLLQELIEIADDETEDEKDRGKQNH